jgi:ferredoxin
MNRKIIRIDEEKCTGCGNCINACHEGALQLINGKAVLVSDVYCDGLGACLPDCPADAITIEEREAAAFDEEAVKSHLAAKKPPQPEKLACGCPGHTVQSIKESKGSMLRQWPCQIRLVPVNASFFDNAALLVSADCCAYAYANLHHDFMKDKVTLIGCPKLDDYNYTEKLTEIIKTHNIRSINVVHMEVPCCGGLVKAVTDALAKSGKNIHLHVVTISTGGDIISEQ